LLDFDVMLAEVGWRALDRSRPLGCRSRPRGSRV